MTDANGKDEFGRDIHLRESYHTRQALLKAERNAENVERERSEVSGGYQSAVASNQGSRSFSTSRSSSRVSRRSLGGRDSDGLVGLRLDGEHGVAGTKRTSSSQSRTGDQPLDWRSPKGSPPIGVPAGASCEGLGAGRRETEDRSPRSALKRFMSTSGSCCFSALTWGWQECSLGAEYDLRATAECRFDENGEVDESRVGEYFCLAHT